MKIPSWLYKLDCTSPYVRQPIACRRDTYINHTHELSKIALNRNQYSSNIVCWMVFFALKLSECLVQSQCLLHDVYIVYDFVIYHTCMKITCIVTPVCNVNNTCDETSCDSLTKRRLYIPTNCQLNCHVLLSRSFALAYRCWQLHKWCSIRDPTLKDPEFEPSLSVWIQFGFSRLIDSSSFFRFEVG